MTTKELIKKLQELDPDGNMKVWLNGCYYDCEVDGAVKCEGENWHTGEPTYWIELE